jgi:hypothetical protein
MKSIALAADRVLSMVAAHSELQGPHARATRVGFKSARFMASAVLALTAVACGSNPVSAPGYDGFLNAIAADCKPLIIGSDDIGQAIRLNGVGANPDNYTHFLGSTSALYAGSISPAMYQRTVTAFLNGGASDQRAFDCIFAHLPQAKTAAPATAAPGK